MKILFFDLETTGVDHKRHAIHQLSGAIIIDDEFQENFNMKMRPFKGAEIDPEALKIAGVTPEQISEYPDPSQVLIDFKEMLAKYVDKYDKFDKLFLAGYNNAAFDNQFLRSWFERCGDKYFGSWFWANTIDVMVLATQKLLDTRHLMPNFQLKTVARALFIEIDESKLHDAEYDIDLTIQIYLKVTK